MKLNYFYDSSPCILQTAVTPFFRSLSEKMFTLARSRSVQQKAVVLILLLSIDGTRMQLATCGSVGVYAASTKALGRWKKEVVRPGASWLAC